LTQHRLGLLCRIDSLNNKDFLRVLRLISTSETAA
jgi:hypothetical protein